jgi:hypothetical protein
MAKKLREEFCSNRKPHSRHTVYSPKTGTALYVCPGVNG